MRQIFRLLPFFCLPASFAWNGGVDKPGTAMMVRDGQPAAVIVTPAGQSRAEQYAAAELQKYLEKISGARLEIVPENQVKAEKGLGPESSRIFIGRCRESAPLYNMLRRKDADAFAVKVERQQIGEMVRPGQWDDRPGNWHDVFLVGASGRGTVYAVYDFLERDLGCRWLAPGEVWEEIPQTNTVAAATGARMEEPVMKYRQDNSLDHSDWGLKQKANICRRIAWPFAWMDRRYREVEPLPVELRGWEGVHDAPRIAWGVSAENPEWFAADQAGARYVGYEHEKIKGQICFSNPEVRDLLADRLSQLLRERPELDFVEVGCEDGLPRNYCHCGKCLDWDAINAVERGKRGMHTHRWLALVNAVAKQLAESDPAKKLVAAAYATYQEPPDPEVIKPDPNVIIMYWSWYGCRVHGYDHAGESSLHTMPRKWIEAWSGITPGGMIMSEYVSRSSMDGMVGANPARFINDMRYLQRHGFAGYNAFDSPIPWGIQTVNRYAIAKAMWNPGVDPETLIRDFCDHAFHAASGHMQQFINTIENAMQTAACQHCYATSWMTPATMQAARRRLDAAHAAAEGDPAVAPRLREYEWHFRYSEMAGPAYNLGLQAMATRKTDLNPEILRKAIKLGEAALAYRKAMLEKHPGARFPTGHRLCNHAGEDGDWRKLLAEIEPPRKPDAGTGDGRI